MQVINHWDPLTACIVGKTYSAEFYHFITDTLVRQAMEQIALETNEDLAHLAARLESYGVTVLRPDISDDYKRYQVGNKLLPAPLTPRDYTAVIDDVFFMPEPDRASKWRDLRGESWQEDLPASWNALTPIEREDLETVFGISKYEDLVDYDFSTLHTVHHWAIDNASRIVYNSNIDSAMVLRLGNRLIVGNWFAGDSRNVVMQTLQTLFPEKTIDLVETIGHLDGTFTVPAEGLVVASSDLPDSVYQGLFPDWEVVRVRKSLPSGFKATKQLNDKAWHVPAKLNSVQFSDYVGQYLNNWVGNISETTTNVNLLMVNPTTAFCAQEDKLLFRALERYGITPDVVPFRHYSFWDSGLHCVTSDIDRSGHAD